jgi:hypothetical protein
MTSPAKQSGNRVLKFLGAALAAAPVLIFSWMLFGVWADPMARDGGSWVRFGVGVMLLEFILLHSGAFMGAIISGKFAMKKRLLACTGLLLFYGLMAWGFAASTDSPALLWIFAAVVTGRILTAVFNRQDGIKYMLGRSAIGIVCYLLVAFGSVLLPIPEWGITSSVVELAYPDRGGGIWELEPQRAIAAAAVYFLLMGLAELFLLGPNWAGIGDKPNNEALSVGGK